MNKKKITILAALILAASALLTLSCSGGAEPKKDQAVANATPAKKEPKVLYWVDPMHPSYKSDKPGIAPDCGMQLTPVYAQDTDPGPSKTQGERKILYYTDPMNPAFRSDKPGKAPDGMDLVPVYADEGQDGSSPNAIRISGRKQQLINLKIAEVQQGLIGQNIRTTGTLQYDETKIVKIHSRIEGWIDKVFVNYTGAFIRKGQPLFSIYSPDLVATQQEYLLAVKAEQTLGQSQFADVSSGARSLKASAYRRLKLWDVSDKQIEQLEQTQTPIMSITFYSPISGFVLEKNVFDQQRITYDTETYSIADLSKIWLMADLYEYEAANVHPGQKATMTLSYYPGRNFEGTVDYIYPELNGATRTLKARIKFSNPGFLLKPDMYANVELQTEQSFGFIVPEEAVMDSGERKIVLVQKDETEFESRTITTGVHTGGNVEVLSGLSAGEKVVISGNFLIDSESQLKSALDSMTPGEDQHAQ
jgi:RND family efflux transporter MFP subunit